MAADADQFAARLALYSAYFTPQPSPEPIRDLGPESVGAVEVAAARGRFWRRSISVPLSEPVGEFFPEEACRDAARDGIRIVFHDPIARIPLRDCLFLDCETTGLSGGAGIFAFLIAVGQCQDTQFTIDQYFLSDPSDEGAALDCLELRLGAAAAIVTYNGRAFDLPLLEGRFHLWRLDPAFRAMPNLDLLWPTRALFRHRLASCALVDVERYLLKFARSENLPGSQVPQVYFEYLRQGFSPRLHAVFEHNRHDVASLFAYALWLDRHTHPDRPSLADPDDLTALARFWYRHRRIDPALCALDAADERVQDRAQRACVLELRGRVLKYARRFDEAHVHWSALANLHPDRCDVIEELAKHLEHRRRDWTGALDIVECAIESLRFHEAVGDHGIAAVKERFLHRQARLRRRLGSPAGPTPE